MITETDIWTLTPTFDDLCKAGNYASVTLPWTFNRMMKTTGHRGQVDRALNIAKGIIAQEVLRRKFDDLGFENSDHVKSHRDEDLFDLTLTKNSISKSLDVKTINYYSDYVVHGRKAFTKQLLIANSNYCGPDWRRFFPMMLAHTQISQDKGLYIFAIAESSDPRKNKDSQGYPLTAFVYGEFLPFFCSAKLCKMREEEESGFTIEIQYKPVDLFSGNCQLTILGEFNGERNNKTIELSVEDHTMEVGPFSCISSFQIPYDASPSGSISISVKENFFTRPVRNSLRKDINTIPEGVMILQKSEFVSLVLPPDFKVHIIGWTTKAEFLKNCLKYTGWVWPKDSVDKFANQPWSQITEKDLKTITNIGMESRIQRNPSGLSFGFMKTSGFGPGACCYVFPNTHSGGIKEHNLYVLPHDLNPMNEIIGEFKNIE